MMTGKLTAVVHPAGKRTGQHPSRLGRRSEAGKSLPAALITLAVGSLLLTPFLAFVSSRSLGTRGAETTINAQYAADAGVEFAIWSLLNNHNPTFRAQADSNVNSPQTLPFSDTLNGYTPTITITALPLGVWTPMTSAGANIGSGGSLAYDGGNIIYSLAGGNSRSFESYNITNDTWDSSLDNTPKSVSSGGALVYDGKNFLYALRGGNTKDFWSYQLKSGKWKKEKKTPQNVGQGGNLVYAGGKSYYAFRGSNKNTFWQYLKNKWLKGKKDPSDAPGNVGIGSDLAHDGGDFLYALQGGGRNGFWRYNMNTDNWETLTNSPSIGAGGSLAYNGGSYLYALQGGGSTAFWRYNMDTMVWTSLAAAPAAVGAGSDLVFTSATTGFASRGGGFNNFWKFQITPPRYDILVTAGSVTTHTIIELNGSAVSVLFWDIN